MHPIESEKFQGFFYVPSMDGICIDRTGRVIDERSLSCLLPRPPSPYLDISIPGYGAYHIHRLVAETFISCPGDPSEMQVNHIDGDKLNNDYLNLEWVTSSGNLTHAYENGLRDDNSKVILKDLSTGNTSEFISLSAAARHLKVNSSILWTYLNNRARLSPIKIKFDAVYKGEEWRGLTADDIGKHVNGAPADVLVVDPFGNKFIYGSAAQAAKALGLTSGALRYHLLRGGVYRCGVYEACYYDGLSEAVSEGMRVVIKRDNPNFKRVPEPIVVENTLTGEQLHWDSVTAFAWANGATKSAVAKSIHKNSGRWKHFQIQYTKRLAT